MAIEVNETQLTAFALGELRGAERAAVEAHVAEDVEARRFVAEMRETARLVTNELAHEPVVGLLAVHHAAIERRLEEVEHAAGGRLRLPARHQPLRARMRHWSALGLTAAAAVLIVGGAVAVLAPQLYDPNYYRPRTTVADDSARRPVYLPGYKATDPTADGPSVAQGTTPGSTPDPFVRPDALAADDQPRPDTGTLVGDAARSQDATDRVTVAEGSAANSDQLPFGPPRTEVTPRGKRPRPAGEAQADLALGPPARGGAEASRDAAPVRLARSDDNRGVANYASVLENPFVNVNDSPLSSFAVNVDSTSYAAARRALLAGRKVAPGDVRVEEFLNYFAYDSYTAPEADAAFAASIEVADCPWNSKHRLVRIGLRGKDATAAAAVDKRPQPGNVVLLVDVSAAMAQADRLPVLKRAMRSLVETMTPADRIAIVTFGGASGGGATTLLPPTSGREKQKALDAIDALTAGRPAGAGDAAIEAAYKAATQFARAGVVSRVILCTAGGSFAGDEAQQLRMRDVVAEAGGKSNIPLNVIGIVPPRLNDPALRQLAAFGSGTYAPADTAAEATNALTAAATPAPPVIAKDVRVQVEFNPLVAGAYRLIGYENGPLSTDDAAAGDQVTAGRRVTALYEVVPAGQRAPSADVFALKYSQRAGFQPPADGKSDEMLTLKLHYLVPGEAGKLGSRSEDRPGKFLEFAVKDAGGKYAAASPDFKFAAAVAEFALVLRGSEHRGNADLQRVARLAAEGAGADKSGPKGEFLELVKKAIASRGE